MDTWEAAFDGRHFHHCWRFLELLSLGFLHLILLLFQSCRASLLVLVGLQHEIVLAPVLADVVVPRSGRIEVPLSHLFVVVPFLSRWSSSELFPLVA